MSPAKYRKGPDRRRRAALRRYARVLRGRGFQRIAGADEAGAGPLAGPLVAAAVILPRGARLPGVDDSKRLSAAERTHWATEIRRLAIAWTCAHISAAEIDEIGPYQGSLRAMERAVAALEPAPDYLLVDARHLPGLSLPQEAFIGGDGRHLAIAAASVVAKDHRDALMCAMDLRYPGYGFVQHKGYGTPAHLAALERLGPCPEHRRSYGPVRRVAEAQARLF